MSTTTRGQATRSNNQKLTSSTIKPSKGTLYQRKQARSKQRQKILDFYLYNPATPSPLNMGTIYRMLMLISGLTGIILTQPFYAWLSVLFFLASCFNQPLPLGYKYPLTNVLFPFLLMMFLYNVNEQNNPMSVGFSALKGSSSP